MRIKRCSNCIHTWIIEGETSKEIVTIRFDPVDLDNVVNLTEEIELTVVETYRDHIQSLSEWSPHQYVIREADLRNVLSGKGLSHKWDSPLPL